ncbi:beta-glucosidase family protein [Bifidobacterium sp.]|uniref:beta-glucosidase family protein n=1 Tax=Bifidobacterium sp. TaxID=41200 RepID=UPI0025C020ED|nr:glycoside hydrolase family 3 C-terminal domain-containing protein [Bifidobacterium sp.]MCH4209311.1 glycoside hydrolase family 3 C-terminal domain-containing protein [Bifidobacterium sp.]MCI1224105.1 glycoside hydrolase family 3 C-terminal domain-containing protein [Bifidobacterium sp.]
MTTTTTTTLTVEQKASLTSGATTWTSQGIEGVVDALHMSDGPHGVRYQGDEGDSLGIASSRQSTCFPPAAGLASTWDRRMIETVARTLAQEARSLAVSVLLGPGLNIKRSPLGGRNFEYASEDPFLAGAYGSSFVRGVQSQGVSAVPKHFAANNQETDRFRVNAQIDERTLREIYLPAFETTVRQDHPWALMCAYNKVNGEYASQNRRLLTDILRGEWRFDGVVISDWGAVVDRVSALAAGLDIEMPPSGTDSKIVDAVRSGACSIDTLDQTVSRIRILADRTADVRIKAKEPIDFESHDRVARKAAQESMVLLKNNGILPIDPSSADTIAVIGEFARTPRFQGGGSSHVNPPMVHDLLGELGEALPQATLRFAPGYRVQSDHRVDEALLSQARRTAQEASVAIVVVGYLDNDESEGMDKTSIDLHDDQRKLLQTVIDTGTPTVVILSGGGVISIGDWAEHCDALLEGWLLGQAGGAAMADVLTGAANPSGRLNETIPRALDDTPCRLNFPGCDGQVLYGEGLYVGYRYYDTLDLPISYPFGYGLSYTTFSYSDLRISQLGQGAQGAFTVTNTGSCRGADVPQIYVASGQPGRPAHELKGFERVELEPGESKEVSIDLDMRAFSTWNTRQARWRQYPGQYRIELSRSSRDTQLSATVELPGDGYVASLEAMSTIGEWSESPYGAPIINPLVQGIAENMGGGEPSPEMKAMFMQMPLIKLASWGIGISEENVDDMVRRANDLRCATETVDN